MPSSLAVALWFALVVFLFVRDHKNHRDLSPHLWIPLVWLFLIGSKSLSAWLNLGANQVVSIEAYAEGSALDRYSLLLLFMLAARVVLKRKLPWASLFRENKVVLYFIVYCLLSIVWSEYPIIALKRFIRFSGMLPIALLVLSERSPVEAVMAVVRRCSYLLVSLSFLFIRYLPQFGRYYNAFTYEQAYCGVGGNKNELGILSMVAFLVLLWDLMHKKGDKRELIRSVDTWTTLLMLLMSAYLLRIAHSATSLFCALVGSLIIIGTSLPAFKRNPRKAAYRVLGMGVMLAILEALFHISTLVILALGRDPTLTNRTFLWKTLLGMGTNPIIGTGYESFWSAERITYVRSVVGGGIQSHNGYIDTYLNLGIIGVFFFVALLLICFRIIAKDMLADFSFNSLRLAFLVIFIFFNYSEGLFPRLGLLLAIFFFRIILIPKGRPGPASGSTVEDAFPA